MRVLIICITYDTNSGHTTGCSTSIADMSLIEFDALRVKFEAMNQTRSNFEMIAVGLR